MHDTILTFQSCPTLGRFDDTALAELQQRREPEQLREHIVTVQGEPCMVCIATQSAAVRAASLGAANVGRTATAPSDA